LDKSKIKLGIAPIGWVNDDMPELGAWIPFEQIISEAAEAGFEGTEVGNKYPKDPKVLKKALAAFKLSIASAWYSSYFTTEDDPTPTIEGFKKHMYFLKAMGCKVVVVAECGHGIQGQMDTPVIPNKPELDDDGWRQLAEGLDNIGGIARDEDMKVVYHHHMGTVVQSREEIDRLMSMTDPELVFLLADTGHITFSGGDPVSLIHDYADRIKHIHLKDIRADVLQRVKDEDLSFLQAVKEGVFTVPGDGMIDYAPIFAEIEAMGYEGWLLVEAEQDPEKANPLEYAQKAREYIRELAGI
ncbi:MAG TPA: myo-inosose-2 dehydratase, partial [Candidatus Lokiarchaeia archaeon]|nr:myo-inosose-2 dehydratase [Candidatus Lokiarchaeia archaeon]